MSDQQKSVYDFVLNYGRITSAEVVSLLGVGERRSRVILKNMVDGGILRKEGSARNTVYIRNENPE